MTDKGSSSRYPLVTVLMFVVGLALLLPGLCSLLFSLGDGGLGLFISIGGVLLVVFGARRLMTSPTPTSVSEGVKLGLLLFALALMVAAGVGIAMLLQGPLR